MIYVEKTFYVEKNVDNIFKWKYYYVVEKIYVLVRLCEFFTWEIFM